MKIVESPMSTYIRWSSSSVNAENGLLRITSRHAAITTTRVTGCRMHSRKVLRAMAQTCSRKTMIDVGAAGPNTVKARVVGGNAIRVHAWRAARGMGAGSAASA